MSSDDAVSALFGLDVDQLRAKLLALQLQISESDAQQHIANYVASHGGDVDTHSPNALHAAKKTRLHLEQDAEAVTLSVGSTHPESSQRPSPAPVSTPKENPTPLPSQKSTKSKKKDGKKTGGGLNWSGIPRRRIALKFSYVGTNYNGFAFQKSEVEQPQQQAPQHMSSNNKQNEQDVVTIEGTLIKALQQACLIPSVDACNYTRCGRTDRGVHALSQVIALDVRTKWIPSKFQPSATQKSGKAPMTPIYCWCDIPGYIPAYSTPIEYVASTHVMTHLSTCRRTSHRGTPIVSTSTFPLLKTHLTAVCGSAKDMGFSAPSVVRCGLQEIPVEDTYSTRDVEWFLNYRFRPMYPDLVSAKQDDLRTGLLCIDKPDQAHIYQQSPNYNFHEGVSLYDNELLAAYNHAHIDITGVNEAALIGNTPIYSTSSHPALQSEGSPAPVKYNPRFNYEYSPQIRNNDQFVLQSAGSTPSLLPIDHHQEDGLYHMDRLLPLAVDQSFIDDDEYDYVSMLNRLLPDDIRVSAWSPVCPSFSARFQCEGRVYKYFFYLDHMDLCKMQHAAKYMIGKHDFRNICTMDVVATQNFVRTISDIAIQPVVAPHPHSLGVSIPTTPQQQQHQMNDMDDSPADHSALLSSVAANVDALPPPEPLSIDLTPLTLNIYNPKQTTPQQSCACKHDSSRLQCQLCYHTSLASPNTLCEVVIIGEAFLYHQVRSILGLLFLIGRDEEEPSIVADLLDITSNPRKPYYMIASDNGLIMWEGAYHGMQWKTTTTGLFRTFTSFYSRWRELSLQQHVFETMWRNAIPAVFLGMQRLLEQVGLKLVDYLLLYLSLQAQAVSSLESSRSNHPHLDDVPGVVEDQPSQSGSQLAINSNAPLSAHQHEHVGALHKFSTKPIAAMIQAYHQLGLTPQLVFEMASLFRQAYDLPLQSYFPFHQSSECPSSQAVPADISILPTASPSAAVFQLSYPYFNAAPYYSNNRMLMLTPFPLALITPTLPMITMPMPTNKSFAPSSSSSLSSSSSDHLQHTTNHISRVASEFMLRIHGMLAFQTEVTVQHQQDRYLLLLILFSAHILSCSDANVSSTLQEYLYSILDRGFPYSFVHKHIPLFQRSKEESLEEKLERLNGRKKARKERNLELNDLYHGMQTGFAGDTTAPNPHSR